MNANHAKKMTKESIIDTNFQKIQDAAFDGSCTSEGYKLDYDKSIRDNLVNLGYEVTSDEKGGWLITWCD
jgi:hypothetical protein